MTSSLPPRRLIPRWRRTVSTLDLAEASFSSSDAKHDFSFDVNQLNRSIKDWRESPSIGHLGDVLAFSVDSDLKDTIATVAREVLEKNYPATSAQRAVIASVLNDDAIKSAGEFNFDICNPAIKREVSELRRILHINPANPLALLDVAQFQLSSGKPRQAERSILTALSLSPNNRLVLRTLARFYVHVRLPDKAHDLLKRHAGTPNDPWLMASEIALADIASVTPKFASRGQRFVKDRSARLADLSELAGALGGLDLLSGSVKRAREFFRIALRSPNDNVIAQAVTHQRILSIDMAQPDQSQVALCASEAQTLLAWDSLNSERAERQALLWHGEEPFSSRPLQFLTTLFAVQNKYDRGINLARRGLIADPKDSTLLANLSYLLASSGELDKAEAILRRLENNAATRFDAIVLATNGLIAMKRGLYELGDQLYLEAMSKFRARGDLSMETNCYAYYARSAIGTNHPRAKEIREAAVEAYKRNKSSDAAIILKQFENSIEPASEAKSARRLSQWVLDEASNTLIERHGVTAPGAPSLVIKPK